MSKNDVVYNLTLSTTEDKTNGSIKVRQSDDDTQVFKVKLIDNSKPKDFEGLTPFFCLFPSGTTGQGLTEEIVQVYDGKNGTLEYKLTPNAWQYLGRNEAYFSFRKPLDNGTWDEQYSTKMFVYQVEKSIYQIKFRDSNYWWTFKELMNQFKGWIDSSKNYWDNFLESVKTTIESIDGGGNVLEIAEFKFSKMLNKWFPTIKDRGDFWDDEIASRGVNPIWFGALPDTGIPAEDAFKKAFSKSNVLCVTQGTYKITGTIELPENAKILCFGKVIFDCDTGLRVFNGSNKKGIALLNFEMIEKGSVSQSNPQDGSKGIYLADCSDFLVQGVKTTGFGAWGIVAINSNNFIITRSEGYKSIRQSGIAVSNCENYTVSNCKCEYNFYSGIISEPAGKNGRIIDNICRYNLQGILVKDDGDNTLVSRNITNFNKEYGMYTEYTKNILYSENIIKFNGDSTKKNIGFGFYGKNTDGISLLYNDIQQNNAHAIYFENVDSFITKKPTIKGNVIKRNCLTYELDNQGEIYIRKATDLTCSGNSVDPTGRAYVIESGTTIMEFDQNTIQRLNTEKKGFAELVPFSRDLQKVTVNFSSSLRQVIFSKPFNIRVVHVEARCMLKSASSVELKINGIARLVTKVNDPNREYSSANQLPINYSSGDDINLQIANTIDNNYIIYYTLDIYYI